MISLSSSLYHCNSGNSPCTYGGVDLLVEVGLLQLERPRVVLDLGVGVVFDVHGRLLALGLADPGVTVGLWR